MGRKSSIVRAPAEVRATIDKLIRQGRFTLDEMLAYVKEKHGEASAPSRTALGRYTQAQEEMLSRMREIDAAARVVVEELGESPDDRAGGLLVQSITTLAVDASMRAQTAPAGEEPSIEEVRKLARAARDVISARTMNLKERQAIEKAAREKLQREQSAALDKIVKQGGLSADTAEDLRKQILGIA